MTTLPTVRGAPRTLSARRIILLTTISGLAAAALFVGVGIKLDPPTLSSAYAAENARRPAGFAEVVEKVKPAVISVRAKMDAGAKTTGSTEIGRTRRSSNSCAASACRTAATCRRTAARIAADDRPGLRASSSPPTATP